MSQLYGVAPAVVVGNQDPENRGRVEIEFQHIEGLTKTFARVATLMSGAGRGSWFMPEVGDEVLVAFAYGDVSHPYVLGFLWNDSSKPPSNDPRQRLLRSVNTHEIELFDSQPSLGDLGLIRIKDAHGNFVELSNGQITIFSPGEIHINAPSVMINARTVAPGVGPI
jgi:uncharacterized protein involved in type VI secretion and phage assembly